MQAERVAKNGSVGESPTAGNRDAASREAADYIASMAAELRRLAAGGNLDFLAYLIDMVAVEAARAARGEDAHAPVDVVRSAKPGSRDGVPAGRQDRAREGRPGRRGPQAR